jgi:hypothetical protein
MTPSLLSSLLGIPLEELRRLPEGKHRLLLSTLYDALVRDEAVHFKLVDALIHHDDVAGIKALRAELAERVLEDYREIMGISGETQQAS